MSGVSEATVRIPSTLAGIGTILITFVIGFRLFGRKTALMAALLLLSSTMFLFWSRTASAESFNTLAIWTVFWAFLAGASEGRFSYVVLLYGTAALGSFFKGPVAGAASFSAILLYSVTGVVARLRNSGLTYLGLRRAFYAEFRWIASPQGVAGLATGLTLFTALLLVPVVLTGSWSSVSLMWKENVTRFFAPFDHTDPPSVYLKYILLLCAPWTPLMLASLWDVRFWQTDRRRLWAVASTFAILLFFVISGSRRGYYILPLLPCLALLAGKAMADWMDGRTASSSRVMRVAAVVTSALIAFAGVALAYISFAMEMHGSLLAMAVVAVLGALASLLYFLRKKTHRALTMLFALMIICEAWGCIYGTAFAERKRTLRTFAEEAARQIRGVEYGKVCLYQQATASLIFYLNHGSTIANCNTIEEIEQLRRKHPDAFLIVDVNEFTTAREREYLNRMDVVLAQNTDPNEHQERFALLKFKNSQP
jgi:4-amino-4-deoxy-L-arabinose transferase-like glycosyltransferase